LHLHDGSPNSRDLIDKSVDIAIRLSPVVDSSAISEQIGTLRGMLCAAPNYLASHAKPQSPDDLTKHNCLVHLKSAPDWVWHLRGPLAISHVSVTGTFSANSSLDCGRQQSRALELPNYHFTASARISRWTFG